MESLKDYNIVLINIDGFRKDKIDLCPTLKSLKENSIYFSNMFTVAPYTFAAIHAIFSGTYPSTNGVNAYYNIFKFNVLLNGPIFILNRHSIISFGHALHF